MGCTIRSGAAAAAVLALTFLQLAVPARAGAQSAWLPFGGEASVSLTFQSLNYGGHFDETGAKREGLGEIAVVLRHRSIRVRADGSARGDRAPAVHRLEVHRLPWTSHSSCSFSNSTRSTGAPIRQAGLSVDTGDYYATFQDFALHAPVQPPGARAHRHTGHRRDRAESRLPDDRRGIARVRICWHCRPA